MDWLLKTEPGVYSFEDLVAEGRTTWDGISNPTAQMHLRSMKRRDRVVIYHTGAVRAAVGLASVDAAPRPEPEDPRRVTVTIRAGKPLKKSVPLDEIRSAALFAGSPLLRIGRLSVVPLTPEQYRFLSGG